MRLYALNYQTIDSYEAEIDDPTTDEIGLQDFAAPEVFSIATDSDLEEKIKEIQDAAHAERMEGYEEGDEKTEYRWKDKGWNHPAYPRHRAYTAFWLVKSDEYEDLNAEPVAIVVAQQVEGKLKVEDHEMVAQVLYYAHHFREPIFKEAWKLYPKADMEQTPEAVEHILSKYEDAYIDRYEEHDWEKIAGCLGEHIEAGLT